MNIDMDLRSTSSQPTWTWADILSTWRLWALLISYVLSSAVVVVFPVLVSRVAERVGLRPVDLFGVISVRIAAHVIGFIIAFVAAQAQRLRGVIVLAGLLQLVGLTLVIVPGAATPIALRMVGAACWGAGYGTLLLAIPTAVAGALGGSRVFVAAFGMMLYVSWILNLVVPQTAGPVLELGVAPASVLLPMSLAALVVLLSVNRNLFNGPPALRGRPFPIVHRGAVVVALLSLVPFYSLYWLFETHGEVASLAPSQKLLSPWASVGIVFVPLMFPLVTTALINTLNEHALTRQSGRLHSPIGIFFWSLLLPPVGIAFVQSAINRSTRQLA